MLNNEAGQNYVVVASAALGYSRPLTVARASFNTASSSEGEEGLVEGGGFEYENGINVPTPKGRLHHDKPPPAPSPLSLCLWLTTQKKGAPFIHRRNVCFYCSPGGISDALHRSGPF